jgi:hypothetical protein
MTTTNKPNRRIHLRWIFLGVYLALGGVLFLSCFLSIGHSPYCEYTYYALLPAGLGVSALLGTLPLNLIPDGPVRTVTEILLVLIPFLATCGQYFLLGWLVDRTLDRRSRA